LLVFENGLEEIELSKIPYNLFYKFGFLENENHIEKLNSRGNLFIKYLNINHEDNKYLKKKILIFGAGAGGSSLLYLLAQFGFKNLFILDSDTVEISDVYRVLTFNKSDIGVKKVEVLKNKIYENYSTIVNIYDNNIVDYDELHKIIKKIKPSLIVKAADPKGIFLNNLNTICFKENIPYISMAYSFEFLKIGPFLIPGVTSCYKAYSDYAIDNFGGHYDIQLFERLFTDYLYHPSISFNINMLSSMIFKEILFFLTENFEYCESIGRQLIINSLNFNLDTVYLKCKPECLVCKTS
jgi:molybdopterin/thiamine biosynthesis adenylyltransferase